MRIFVIPNNQDFFQRTLLLVGGIIPYCVVLIAWHIREGMPFVYSVFLQSEKFKGDILMCICAIASIFVISYALLFKMNRFCKSIVVICALCSHLLIACFLWLVIESRIDKYLI